jgi:hypothetical protein
MPHYKDGTEAKVGDRARGKCHSHGCPVEGVILSVTPGTDSCNAQLAYPVIYRAGGVEDAMPVVTVVSGWCTLSDLERVEPAPWGK